MSRARSRLSAAPLLHMLHNMSAPPRTTVVCEQRTVYGPLVVFSLTSFLQRTTLKLSKRLRQRVLRRGFLGLRAEELRLAFKSVLPSGLVESDLAQLSAPWSGVLIGRRRLEEHADEGVSLHADEICYCTDLELVLAVLSRCENGLYIGHRTPSGGLMELCARTVAFDDPRSAGLDCLRPHGSGVWPLDEQQARGWTETRCER